MPALNALSDLLSTKSNNLSPDITNLSTYLLLKPRRFYQESWLSNAIFTTSDNLSTTNAIFTTSDNLSTTGRERKTGNYDSVRRHVRILGPSLILCVTSKMRLSLRGALRASKQRKRRFH